MVDENVNELDINSVEVFLKVDESVIRETLSRMGIVNNNNKMLYPSCYLLKQFNKYYIFHFKELFSILRAGSYNNISKEDINRKNAIIFCLKNWGMVDVDEELIEPHNNFVFVLPHNQKKDYMIVHKFNIGALQDEVN